MFLETFAYIYKSEFVTYIPLIKIVAKEGGNISSNVIFQISPHGVFNVIDLLIAYLKFDIEK